MKTSSHIFKFIVLCCNFAAYACVVSKYNALIFDRIKKSLIEVPSNKIPEDANYKQWASACPAEDNNDETNKIFNEEKSLYKNALFVRYIYSEKDQQNFAVNICDKPFKLSIVSFNEISFYSEFGYDIYVDKSDEEKFTLSDKSMYRKFQDEMKVLASPTKLTTRLLGIPYNAIKSILKSRGKETIKQDKEKGFIWIPLFKVKIESGQLRKIKYDIRMNNRQPLIECDNHSLGEEMFHNIDAKELYLKDIQEEAFNEAELPKESKVACKNTYECFEKWSLIPTDQFQFGSSALPTCSNVTTIPIWSSILKRILQKVDDFLYALSRMAEKPLHIIAGVHKHLLLPSKTTLPPKKLMILKKDGFALYVPKIIYKMVKLKSKNTCKEQDPNCWSGVLIVIHNNPNFKQEHRICENSKTNELGWTEITMYETISTTGARSKSESEHTYVCPITKDTLEHIGLKYI
ncbi:uncharacterized protein LOC135838535 [Planococcus citri]|uniref:uncharacterized protein LOC135838535 n=1 Tax=Planococcus citri TaxID=170843 RepID=UPI0031FA0397